jgi:hypothetical protein
MMHSQFFKILFLNIAILQVGSYNLLAQNTPVEICGYQYELEKIIQKQPNYLALQNEWYRKANEAYLEAQSTKRKITADTIVYEIPVVFHVIYNTNSQNISDALILSQLNELNLDYRKLNPDTSRIRPVFKALAADIKIRFILADKDPSGNPTTGINRINTSRSTFATNIYGSYSEDMKSTNNGGQTAWNPARYMNIWVCNMEYPSYIGITYGFATPPTGSPNWVQFQSSTKDSTDPKSGIVLHYKVFGKNNPLAPNNYKEANTATHEVGHYLGLRHIWGDAANPNTQGCNVDDGIFDTPNARDKNYSCSNATWNSCVDASNDKPDMTENYMDYALDGCAAMFTREQAFMMRYVLNNLRTGLPIRTIVYDTTTEYTETVVSVYPNPTKANNHLTVVVNSNNTAEIFSVTLFDNNGKEVLQKRIQANQKTEVFTAVYSAGVYYLLVKDSNGNIIKKEKLVLNL